VSGRIIGFLVLCTAIFLAGAAPAQEARQFKIGTGEIGGTYYPIGQTIAAIVGTPMGERACFRGPACGVPGLTTVALTSQGSKENVEGVAGGWMDAGFVQSDVAFWAYSGTGAYAGEKPFAKLRALASLYPESVHLVVRTGAGIASLAGLRGRRVALGDRESGTLVGARLVLAEAGIDESRGIRPLYIAPDAAAAKLALGELDAFFIVAGYPALNVSRVVWSKDARVLPIDRAVIAAAIKKHRYFSAGEIPRRVYGNAQPIPTLDVHALMVVSEAADSDLIYQVTQALWRESARNRFASGHSKGLRVTLETALKGIGIPLHPGAARYYREIGKLK